MASNEVLELKLLRPGLKISDIYHYTSVVGGGEPLYVIGNSSAAMTEGIVRPWVSGRGTSHDGIDSGSQMVPFTPPGSTLLVQMPDDKFTDENVALSERMFELEKKSLERVGISIDASLKFVANAHEYLERVAEGYGSFRVVPLFLSTRIFGRSEVSVAANKLNNKANFVRLVESIRLGKGNLRTPVTYLPDFCRYPDSGFPPVEEIIKDCIGQGSSSVFFKQNVSAGGHGVDRVRVYDREALTDTYEKWAKLYREAAALGSGEWDYHIQLGVTPREIRGEIDSPCVAGLIAPKGESYEISILQVALQRLKDGKEHMGNIIDPWYEKNFIGSYGDEVMAVLDAMAKEGLRGHVGLDVMVDTKGKLYFIEVNPRLNGHSRVRVLRDHIVKGGFFTTNNTAELSSDNLGRVSVLGNYFCNFSRSSEPGLVITRFPRFFGDIFGLDFVNDYDGKLERVVMELLGQGDGPKLQNGLK